MKNLSEKGELTRISKTGKRILLMSLASACIAVLIVLGLFFGIRALLANRELPEDDAAARQRSAAMLQRYVEGHRLSSREVPDLLEWAENRRLQVVVFGTLSDREVLQKNLSLYGVDEVSKTRLWQLENALEIRFTDKSLYLFVDKVPAAYYGWLLTAFLVLLVSLLYAFILLLIMRRDIKYMVYLRDELNRMSGGDLTREIEPYTKTEIGQIGEGLNALRISVADQMKKEYEALTANRELITAMSHDLRTPLTRQIGYLEILHLKKYENEQQRDLYINKARNNAFVMKDTTDKLFRYFLAFGHSEQTEKLVEVDGRALLNSALREQTDYLKSQQFAVSYAQIDEAIRMQIDPDEFARIFDNIFQNIRKYGDNAVPVMITYEYEPGRLLMMIQNSIREDISKVESTKIGLKIVDKIMTAMGGSAEVFNDGKIFIMQLMFPVTTEEKKGL